MEFVIQKNDLVRELQTVTGVVEKRATIPILANLLLEAGKGGLQVGASDMEVTIRGTAEATVVNEGSVTLPAAKLHEIARSLPEAEVRFKLLDRTRVLPLVRALRVDGFAWDVELLFLCDRFGLAVAEVPVGWREERRSHVRLLSDPWPMLWECVRLRWRWRSGGYDSVAAEAPAEPAGPDRAKAAGD